MNDLEMESIFELMGSRLKRGDSRGNRPAQCPLAPWLHTKGQDKSPSVTAKAGNPALYKCWACNNSGTLFHLAKLYGEHSGDYRPLEYMKSVTKSTFWGRPIEYGAKYKSIGRRVQQKMERDFTEEKLRSFLDLVPEYAFERGLTRDQILRWEVGYDPRENRAIFTVRDYMGKLAGVSGRTLSQDVQPKYKHYAGLRKESVLYGERFLDRMTARVYLVEGFLDVLALERAGVRNALGSMGTTLSESQLKKLDRWAKEIVFIPDADDKGAGLQFAQIYGEKLFMAGKKVGVAGVRPNEKYCLREKPKLWEECDYKFVPLDVLRDKDPADLSAGDLESVLSTICWVDLKPGVRTESWL